MSRGCRDDEANDFHVRGDLHRHDERSGDLYRHDERRLVQQPEQLACV